MTLLERLNMMNTAPNDFEELLTRLHRALLGEIERNNFDQLSACRRIVDNASRLFCDLIVAYDGEKSRGDFLDDVQDTAQELGDAYYDPRKWLGLK